MDRRLKTEFYDSIRLGWLWLLVCFVVTACPAEVSETAQTAPATAAGISAPTSAYPEIGQPGGERVMGMAALPATFNPYVASDAASMTLSQQLFVGLTAYDAVQKKLVPALAERWEHNPEQTVWTFVLCEGLKWSDGQPLTADDVAFTYQQVIDNPLLPNNYRDFWAYLPTFPQVKALDARTVQFVLPRPFSPLLYNLMAPIVPRHIFADSLQPDSDGRLPFAQRWNLNTPPETVVSSGPWRLVRYVPGQRVVLARNPHYYERDAQGQQLPYLERLQILEVQNAQTALLRFRQGELDTYLMSPGDYELLGPEQQQGHFTIHNLGPAPSSLFVMFNQSTARRADGTPLVDPVKSRWFRDPAFRKALSHLIDKQGLIDSVYKGRAVSQYSHLNSHNPFYHTGLSDYTYDPARSRAILAAAGYRWDAENRLLDAQGQRVRFELTTNAANAERDATCALLRQAWSEIGMEVTYRPQAFQVLVGEIHERFSWEVMLLGLASNSLEPHFSSSRWRLDGRMHLFNMGHASYWQGQPTTYTDWEQELEQMYREAAHETDPLQRQAHYWRAQEIERDALPFLYTVSEMNLVAVRNHLGNIRPSVYGGNGLQQVNWNSAWHFVKTQAN
ncbi:MAG: ABC transporter substrate-binding protein [Candidatus Sericytochromatia bacterium]|nr:ABC transporter substrate-binding protein [Candidatus Sericytochromatia bacterium]